jgi:hypothetical protein
VKRPYHFTLKDIPDDHLEREAEVRLWRSVIDQQIQDFLSEDRSEEARVAKGRARIWLRAKSADFWTVCHLAALDPLDTRRAIFVLLGGEDVLY